MIYIDFQGGAHGNYLEFVCNKILAKIKTNGPTPFNTLGSSHSKKYLEPQVFQSGHYSFQSTPIPNNSKVIAITISNDDLLPLQSISLLRAGDRNIDPDQLEINTYNKWTNSNYQWVLDNLINGFFKDQLTSSYNAVKDQSWPDVSTIEEFKTLPDWIQEECVAIHNLTLYELDSASPDCPRHVLREFFKLGFKNPEQAGFITEQKKMTYDSSNDVRIFPYSCFYHTDQFITETEKLAGWLGFNFEPTKEFIDLHKGFLSKQPYKDTKVHCDTILERIKNKEEFELPKLNLLEESYLTAHIELCYNIELLNNLQWFQNSKEILDEC
tara:strand:- start:29124 stop:30101 length:978 start_codon:yes stop_codon:yes gene_type:complete